LQDDDSRISQNHIPIELEIFAKADAATTEVVVAGAPVLEEPFYGIKIFPRDSDGFPITSDTNENFIVQLDGGQAVVSCDVGTLTMGGFYRVDCQLPVSSVAGDWDITVRLDESLCYSASVHVGCNLGEYESLDSECHPCPRGADCGTSGNTLRTLVLQSGHWRSSSTSDVVMQCFYRRACHGGRNATSTNSSAPTVGQLLCAKGYHGPLVRRSTNLYAAHHIPRTLLIISHLSPVSSYWQCALCDDGYAPAADYSCTECSEDFYTRLWVTAGLVVLLVVIVVVCIIIWRDCREVYIRCTGLMGQSVRVKAKILFVFGQILGSIPSIFSHVQFPEVYRRFLSTLSDLFRLNLFKLFQYGCVMRHGFVEELAVVVLLPVGFCILAVVGYSTKQYWRSGTLDKKDGEFILHHVLLFTCVANRETTHFLKRKG
jgi:hypothetical protein